MIEKPLVSIIIPTYNRGHLIGETLDSILLQTYINWECIIVDDGSDDNTKSLLEEYCSKDNRFQYHIRPKDYPKGANSCRNFGFELSKGQFIQWFDSDDLMHKSKIECQLIDLIKTDKEISISNFSMFRDTIENSDSIDAVLKPDGKTTFLSFVSGKSLLNMQITLFKRPIVEKIKFDETLYQSQDLDFMYRILKDSHKNVSILNKVLCHIRKHSDTITIRFRRGHINELNSEIRIREQIFFEMYSALPKGDVKSGLLRRTLYAYRALLVHGHIQEYLKKMTMISKHIKPIKKLKLIWLVCLGLFYSITKKGLYSYGKFLQTI